MVEHLNEFNSVTSQLSSVQIYFEDEVRALILLSSLPESWNATVTGVSSSKESTKLKYDDIRDLILSEEIRKMESGESSGSYRIEGLVATSDHRGGRGFDKGSGSRWPSRPKSRGKSVGKFKCYYCAKEGHKLVDCNKLKRDREGRSQDSDQSSNAHSASAEEIFPGVTGVLTVITGMDNLNDKWILDTGCSYHMCPMREWFDTYKPCNGGIIQMANGAISSIIGTGAITIKMFDGTAKTLENVSHALDMKMNLISLSMLESEGFAFKAKDGALRVVRGATIVMKGKRQGGLYTLLGSTTFGRRHASSSRAAGRRRRTRKTSVKCGPKNNVTFALDGCGSMNGFHGAGESSDGKMKASTSHRKKNAKGSTMKWVVKFKQVLDLADSSTCRRRWSIPERGDAHLTQRCRGLQL